MDYQTYQQPNSNFSPKRSRNMETASLILGILSLALFCCVYPPMICGALSITLGLLSRGGELTLTPKAKAGIALGATALGLFVALLIFSTVFLSIFKGGFSNMVRIIYEQYQLYGDDYMSFYNSLLETMPQILL